MLGAFFRRAGFVASVCASLVLLAACGSDDRSAGMCVGTGPTGFTCCGSFWVDTNTDERNCGICGMTCATGQECRAAACVGTTVPVDGGGGGGMCTPSCSSAQRCCGTSCVSRSAPSNVDSRSDASFTNCNGCGIACDAERSNACAMNGSTLACVCGDFAACMPGYSCVMSGGSFRCVDVNTDRENCGTIGNACADQEICQAGMCVCGSTGARCDAAAGQTCCGGACIDTSSDSNNCGACGTVCGANGPSCVDGACRCGTSPACTAPMAGSMGTPGSLGQSCCDGSCIANSETSCGCGVMCESGDDCIVASGGLPFPGLPTGMGVCCGTELPFIGGFCSDGFGFDGGFPLLDGGLPFP
jgi:hypothetical protein